MWLGTEILLSCANWQITAHCVATLLAWALSLFFSLTKWDEVVQPVCPWGYENVESFPGLPARARQRLGRSRQAAAAGSGDGPSSPRPARRRAHQVLDRGSRAELG